MLNTSRWDIAWENSLEKAASLSFFGFAEENMLVRFGSRHTRTSGGERNFGDKSGGARGTAPTVARDCLGILTASVP